MKLWGIIISKQKHDYHLTQHLVYDIHVRSQRITLWHLFWRGLGYLKGWKHIFTGGREILNSSSSTRLIFAPTASFYRSRKWTVKAKIDKDGEMHAHIYQTTTPNVSKAATCNASLFLIINEVLENYGTALNIWTSLQQLKLKFVENFRNEPSSSLSSPFSSSDLYVEIPNLHFAWFDFDGSGRQWDSVKKNVFRSKSKW